MKKKIKKVDVWIFGMYWPRKKIVKCAEIDEFYENIKNIRKQCKEAGWVVGPIIKIRVSCE